MHLVSTTQCRRRGFGQTDVADLPRTNEIRQAADRLFDRRALVDAMQVVQIDDVGAEARQARVAARLDVVRPAVDVAHGGSGGADNATLGGKDDIAAPPAERTADQLFVRAAAIHVSGIEKRDAEIDCPMNRPYRFLVVGHAVALRHAHAAKADRRHGQPAASKLPLLHRIIMLRSNHGGLTPTQSIRSHSISVHSVYDTPWQDILEDTL